MPSQILVLVTIVKWTYYYFITFLSFVYLFFCLIEHLQQIFLTFHNLSFLFFRTIFPKIYILVSLLKILTLSERLKNQLTFLIFPRVNFIRFIKTHSNNNFKNISNPKCKSSIRPAPHRKLSQPLLSLNVKVQSHRCIKHFFT